MEDAEYYYFYYETIIEDRSRSEEEIEGSVLFLTSRCSLSEPSCNIHISLFKSLWYLWGRYLFLLSCLLFLDLIKSVILKKTYSSFLVSQDAGIGTSIDSFYEYLLKVGNYLMWKQ